MKIDGCSFGSIVIDGKKYSSDLIIYNDGRVVDSWWRKKGHILSAADIVELVESKPEVIVAGTGINGLMHPEDGLSDFLSQKGIKFLYGPNQKAIKMFNENVLRSKAGGCFHLTC